MARNVHFFIHNADIRSEGEGRRETGWGQCGVWFSVSEPPAKSLGSNKSAENKCRPLPGGPSQPGSLVQSGSQRGPSGDLRDGPTSGAPGPGGSFWGRVPQASRATSRPGGLPASPGAAGAWVSPAPRGQGGPLEAGRGNQEAAC